MPLSSLLFRDRNRRDYHHQQQQETWPASHHPIPAPSSPHLESLLGLKTLSEDPLHGAPSSSCVTRRLLRSPSISSSSSSSYTSCSCCSTPSTSTSFSSSSCCCSSDSSSMGCYDIGASNLVANIEGKADLDRDVLDDDDLIVPAEIAGDQESAEEEDEEEDDGADACWGYYGPRDVWRRFPPPIPMLAKIENSISHIPRRLTRSYEDGGRLVIRELKIHHHEFFRARRENGRLMLKLIHIDEDDDGTIRWSSGIKSTTTSTCADHGGEEDQEQPEDLGDHDQKSILEEEAAEYSSEAAGNCELSDDQLDSSPPSNSPTSPSSPLPPQPFIQDDEWPKDVIDIETNGGTGDQHIDHHQAAAAAADERGVCTNNVRHWPTKLSLEMLSSSMPETTICGVGNGCFLNGRPLAVYKVPTPVLHLVQS